MGKVSDKESRQRSRPFTAVGMALAVLLAAYLTFQTALAYHRVWSGSEPWPGLSSGFSPAAALAAWGGILLAFFFSTWLFRHSARTFLFYLVGIMAAVSAGPVFFDDARHLLSFFICAVAGYGASHMLVYLWERPYMAMLSRYCLLYRDETRASTTIFTAACVSCFVAAAIAAFHLHTRASLVMLSFLTVVFFVWSFIQRRSEFVYPLVLISVETLLSIWHNMAGQGSWTPARITINAVVFAAGAPLWMAVGAGLNRLRGPMSLLGPPARHMSVVLALVSLGFFVALAVCPLWNGPEWSQESDALQLVLGSACGALLMGFFAWSAAAFRRTVLVYFCGLALLALLVFWAVRTEALWRHPIFRAYWPSGAAVLAVLLVAAGQVLERRRYVLFGRPIFYLGALYAPLLAVVGAGLNVWAGDCRAASLALFVSAGALTLASALRPSGAIRWLAAATIALGLTAAGLAGPLLSAGALLPMGAAIVLLVVLMLDYLRGRRGAAGPNGA